jgi:hypothetical protein
VVTGSVVYGKTRTLGELQVQPIKARGPLGNAEGRSRKIGGFRIACFFPVIYRPHAVPAVVSHGTINAKGVCGPAEMIFPNRPEVVACNLQRGLRTVVRGSPLFAQDRRRFELESGPACTDPLRVFHRCRLRALGRAAMQRRRCTLLPN